MFQDKELEKIIIIMKRKVKRNQKSQRFTHKTKFRIMVICNSIARQLPFETSDEPFVNVNLYTKWEKNVLTNQNWSQ